MSHQDALGHDVTIGKKYGCSISANGITNVVTGSAKKLTPEKVTLVVETRRCFLYGKETTPHGDSAATISVYACHLFPL